MDLSTVVAGLIAYGVSLLASIMLIFLTYRLNTLLTSKIDEERFLLSGHKSIAISLGSVVLSQAILMRHAVFPTMVVLRDLFTSKADSAATVWVLAHCVLFFLIIGVLSFGSVAAATWLFSRMTRKIPEREEILKDNVAIAIFFAFVILGITLIVNEGLDDLSKSLIPYKQTGVIRLP